MKLDLDIAELFERFGVLIVFVNTLLHELAIPIPLTPTVLLAGAATSRAIAWIALVAAVVAGSVIGNAVWFAAGRRYGTEVMRLFCRVSMSPDACITRATEGFLRWGPSFVIVGRFLPGVNLILPPVAGALGMSWSKFLGLAAAGAAAWAVVVVVVGVVLQDAWVELARAAARMPLGIWLVAALLLCWWAWRAHLRRAASHE